MGRIITAKKLWYDGELAIGNCDASFTCDTFTGTSPRNAWLTPIPGCLGSTAFALNLSLPNPLPDGTLQGVWLEFTNGTGIVIDAMSVQDVVNACNECCGSSTAVAPRYGGIWPTPAPMGAVTYTFTRVDAGDWYAYNKASLDYWPGWITNTFNKISHDPDTGETTYSFMAYRPPVWINGDTFVSASDYVYTSNEIPTPGGGQVLVLQVTTGTGPITPKLSASSAANLVTAATANATYSALGTYTYDSGDNKIVLTSADLTAGLLVVTAVTPLVFNSNDPGAPGGGQTVSLTATVDGVTISPNKTAATAAALATALGTDPLYNIYGTWTAVGTAIRLTSAVINSATLALTLIP